jgi:hypothetical protein
MVGAALGLARRPCRRMEGRKGGFHRAVEKAAGAERGSSGCLLLPSSKNGSWMIMWFKSFYGFWNVEGECGEATIDLRVMPLAP